MIHVRETITVTIAQMGAGFFVDSDDLPTLNLLVKEEVKLVMAISEAVKYLYRHNRQLDVRVLMEIPVFDVPATAPPKRELEIAYQSAAA